jgi:uncharacterized membrane protein (UPF0127 family)
VELTTADWWSGPLRVAATSRERWRGLRPRPLGMGLLLAARSVHSFGMAEPLRVASLDAGGRVRRVAVLPPRRVFTDAAAAWMAELPEGVAAPPVGAVLALRVWGRSSKRETVCWHT